MNKPIYQEIHFIRATACLMVVMVHITGVIHNEVNGIPVSSNLILNQFARLGTPVFAVLSAFLLFSSVKNRGFNLKKFMLSRTTKIVFPFIIWTTAYLIYLSYTGWEFHENKLIFIFSNYVLGEGFYHLYFIVTIIQFYCIFPLLQLVRNKSTLLLLFFISLPLNYLSLLIFDNKLFLGNLGGVEHIIIHSSFVMNWISYFLLGAVIAYYYPNIKDFCNKNVKLLTFLFFTVILAISFEINPDSLFVSARPINLVYIPVFVLFLLSIYQFIAKNEPGLNLVNLIGKYSMGIYLVHPFIIIIVEKVLPVNLWIPQLIIIPYALTIIGSIILAKLILLLPLSNYIISVPALNNQITKNDVDIHKRVHQAK